MHAPLHLTALVGLLASADAISNPLRGLLRHHRQEHADEAHQADAHADEAHAIEESPASADAELEDVDDEPPLDRPKGPASLVAMQFHHLDPHAKRNKLEMILHGELHLSSIRYTPTSFANDLFSGASGVYEDVSAEFCDYDPAAKPLSDDDDMPTVHEVMAGSGHCGEHRYRLPLKEVIDAVRAHDNAASAVRGVNGSAKSSKFSNNGDDKSKAVKQLPLAGLLYHTGHSGASLLTNVLSSAFDSTLVVNEHPALRDALGACDTLKNRHPDLVCNEGAQHRLVLDVITLLSRTSNEKLERVHFQLSPTSSAYLPTLRALYPTTPWVFVYRNAAEELAASTSTRARRADCVRNRRTPHQALLLKSQHKEIDMEKLTRHEVCALHLSSLLDAASLEHAESHTGMIVSYDNDLLSDSVVGIFTDVLLPYLGLKDELDNTDPEIMGDRLASLLSVRTDTSRELTSTVVSREVRKAAAAYMNESMDGISRFVNTEMWEVKRRNRR